MAKGSNSGHWGEATAAQYLRAHRYEIVACNFHCRFGEIDLIAKNRKYIVFVEVKTRKDSSFAEAKEFVTTRKQGRIRASAEIWLERNETKLQPRFDVIEVYGPEGALTRHPTVNHLEDAF